jgi:hypothetical protein
MYNYVATLNKELRWWFTPVVPASGRLKAGRSQVQGQPGQLRKKYTKQFCCF